jgi:hypothetical protein
VPAIPHDGVVVRTGLVVAFGAGILIVPHVWWLFVAGLIVTSVIDWPARRRRPIVLSPELGESAGHYHYCPACDQQWRHGVDRCIAHWAAPCPTCGAADAPPAQRPQSA